MATSKPSIASAYVQILPSTEGIGAGIAGALTGSLVTNAAGSAGSVIGGVVGGGMSAALMPAVRKLMPKLGLAGAVAAVGAFGKASIQTGMQFDSAMSQVYMLMSRLNDGAGLTDEQMETLRGRARELGATTQFTAQEVADAMSYMALAGWDVDQVYAGIPAVLQLAAASSMDLGRASDIVTDYMAAFSNTSPEAIELVDLLAYAQSASNATTEQFAEAWKYASPMMNAFSQSAATTTAILARLANQAHKGSTGGVELNAVLTALSQNMDNKGDVNFGGGVLHLADEAGNFRNMIDIFQDMQTILSGVNTDEFTAGLDALDDAIGDIDPDAPGYAEAMAQALANLESSSSGISPGTVGYITALMGTFKNVRGMRGIAAILNGDVQEMREFEDALESAAGTAEQQMNIVNDNLAGDLRLLYSALDDLKIAISTGLTPILRTFVQTITPVINWLAGSLSGKTVFGEAAEEMAQMDTAGLEATGQRIQELIAAINSGNLDSNEMTEALAELNSLRATIMNMDLDEEGENAMKGLAGGMTDYEFTDDAEQIKNTIIGAIDNALLAHSPARAMIPTGENISAGIAVGMDTYSWQDTAEKIANGMTAAVKNQRGTVGSAGGSLISTIKDRMRNLIGYNGSGFNSLGSDIAQGIADGLLNGTFAVTAAIQQLIDDAVQAARDEAGIFSPSRVFAEEVGQPIAAGIGKGISDNAFEAMDALTGTMSMLTSATAAQFSGAGSMPARAAYVFNQTVNSPRALTPWEIARQARNATRQMAEAMA